MTDIKQREDELDELTREIKQAFSFSASGAVTSEPESVEWILEQMISQVDEDLASSILTKSHKKKLKKLNQTKKKVQDWTTRFGELSAMVSKTSGKSGGSEGGGGGGGATSDAPAASDGNSACTILRFDPKEAPTSHCIGTSDKLKLANNSFSVMCWIYIRKFNTTDQNDNAIIGQNSGGNNSQLHLVVRDRKLHFGFYGNDSTGNTVLEECTW